jgi:hypothetical protein
MRKRNYWLATFSKNLALSGNGVVRPKWVEI